MAEAVSVHDLRVAYGATVAVDGASWSASAGGVTAVLGPNGAGKTTTVECLEGLRRPAAGTVRVLGTDPWRASAAHRARVGVMLQDGGLPTTARPLPLLHHLASLYAGRPRVEDLGRRLDLGAFAGTTVRRMSGGQRQRVALAAALLAWPDVVFLDEPTAGLDPHGRLEVWDLVREEAGRGAAVVLTTHSFEEAERIADRVVVLAAGRVVADGTLAEVRGEGSLESAYFALTRQGRP
ncbi:ABC transporter ATP-binding protein [Phycicoccus flavus]|uniref:ABC transporter ATP-binding protein n=1 Tax=Phycicoccus flavus TaxID=2502783 RepID=UPI001F3829D1|nr:ABC transporter ATP-binding protein [Phycicoccus flavus]